MGASEPDLQAQLRQTCDYVRGLLKAGVPAAAVVDTLMSHRFSREDAEALLSFVLAEDQRASVAGNDDGQPFQDYYAILQVSPEAEQEVIEAAYRRLAFKYHPDRNSSAEAESLMRKINCARDVLCDPARRQAYDRRRKDQTKNPGTGTERQTGSASTGNSDGTKPHDDFRSVACARCGGKVSDVAEACPHCGHPQPKAEAREGHASGTCRFCGTFNLLDFHDYLQRGTWFPLVPLESRAKCRACGKFLAEACPNEYRNLDRYDVAANAVLTSRRFAAWSTAATWILLSFASLVWGVSPDGLIMTVLACFAVYCTVAWVTRRRIHKNAYLGDFSEPSRFAKEISEEKWEYLANHYCSHSMWFDRWAECIVTLFIPFFFCGTYWGNRLKNDKVGPHRSGVPEIPPPSIWQLPAEQFSAQLDSGAFSTDLILTNVKENASVSGRRFEPVSLSKCDLTITVTFEDKTKPSLQRYWEQWEIGEKKTINFPSQGKVQRIEVRGSVYDAARRREGKVGIYFTFTR